MQDRVNPKPHPSARKMGVRITRDKHGLKKEHARVPDVGGSAEERQNHLRDHRLDEKEQRRVDENSQTVEEKNRHERDYATASPG